MRGFKLFTFIILLLNGLNCLAQDSLRDDKAKPSFRDKINNDLAADTIPAKDNGVSVVKPVVFDTSSHIIVVPQEQRKGIFAWRDSVVIPKRSAFYSLILPGLGQINNRDHLYIKLPIIYGLLGVGIYFYINNATNYNDARREYAYRLDKGTFLFPKYENFSLADVQNDRDYYKRFLDMTVLLSVAGYGLQVIEANAAAHLKGFDVSDDISMQVRPTGMPTPYGIVPGVTFAFKFR